MRAATAIVGAIAAASVLIALSFILSDGGDSGGTVTTKTVVEVVKPPAREVEASDAEAGQGETGVAHFGGPTQCGKELSVENVSCEVGTQIHEEYVEGGRGELFAEDKEADETITMSCQESAPVECSGPGGAKVYFGD